MNETIINAELLKQFSQFIHDEIGLFFPENRWPDLERAMIAVTKAYHFPTPDSCMRWLMSSPLSQEQVEMLASFLTIGETYFFRENKTFEILETVILPPLIEARRQHSKRLRIWCAGCATGEEPYTIAMILKRCIPDIQDWNISILASDINTQALEKLTRGVYSTWSFRNDTLDIKSMYFESVDHRHYEIHDDLKQFVTPFYLNLSKDEFPSIMNNTNAIDIIFCRNVFMYFSENMIHQVVAKFSACLTPGGWLAVGLSESLRQLPEELHPVALRGITLYQKTQRHELIQLKRISTKPAEFDQPTANTTHETEAHVLALANANKLEEALNVLEDEITKDKTHADLYYLKGLILSELHRTQELQRTLHRILYLNPDHILGNIMIGKYYRDRRDLLRSENFLQHAITLLMRRPKDEILTYSGGITAGRLMEMIQFIRTL